MNQFEEIQIPEIEEKKHFGRPFRRNWKTAAGIFAGIAAAAAIAAFVFVRLYFMLFYKYLRALQLIAKPLLMGSGSPVQRKYAFMSRYGKVKFLYSII